MNSSEEEQIYSIALTMVPGIGHIGAKHLIDGMGNAVDVFRLRKEIPERIPEVSQRVIEALDCPQAVFRAEQEYEFIRKNRISCLTFHDEAYPSRLRECEDAPVVLFFKGNADLNSLHILNMVGTRNATDYGTQICASFLRDLKALCPEVLVVSGLAYGIDIHAHREALANELPTVGVLAHGLDRIYPHVHRKTAVDMLEKGGLLTEFLSGTNPDRHNSKGCNLLIRENRASLLLSAEDFVKAMGWEVSAHSAKVANVQRSLFLDLSEEEQKVIEILEKRGDLQINTLVVEADIPVQKMNTILFELEMKGVVRVLVGGMYQLL